MGLERFIIALNTQTNDTPSGAVNIVAPSISYSDGIFTANPGTWTGASSFSYQWKLNGVAIGGATAETYEAVDSDQYEMLSVTVTSGGTPATSAETEVIFPLVLTTGYSELVPEYAMVDAGQSSGNAAFFYWPRLYYHSGKTYFTYGNKDATLPFQQAALIVYDSQRGIDRPVIVGNVPAVTDTHNVPALAIDNNRIYIVQENTHDTPLQVYKSAANLDYGNFTVNPTFGTKTSYTHLTEMDGGGWFDWARGYTPNDTGYYSIWIMKSPTDFESWGSQIQVTQRPTGDDPFLRHYPFMPTGYYKENGWIHTIIACRKDDGELTGDVWHYRFFHLKTPSSGADCGNVWSNAEETISHSISVDGILSDADLQADFMFHEMDTTETDGFPPVTGIGPTGNFYSIIRDSDGSDAYSFKYFDGSWHTKAISISDLTVFSANPFFYLLPRSDNYITVLAYRTIGGFQRPYLYVTTNQGDSWTSLGDLCPEVNDRNLNFLMVANACYTPALQNFLAVFSYTDTVDTARRGFIFKQAAFGVLQDVPAVSVTAATDMVVSGVTGLWDYECVSAHMSRSGNNVTSLNDKFGVRNASGSNNPQWDGVDLVTCLAASSQRFTLASPANLINKSGMTVIGVAKFTTGVNSFILTFTNTANSNSHLTLSILTANALGTHPATIAKQTDPGTSIDAIGTHGQDDIDDGGKHVFVWIWDGRAKEELRIDGKRQYVQRVVADTLTEWQAFGDGPAQLVTAPNVVNIAMRDTNSDTYRDLTFATLTGYDGVVPSEAIHSIEKFLCTKYSITYNFQDQFEIP